MNAGLNILQASCPVRQPRVGYEVSIQGAIMTKTQTADLLIANDAYYKAFESMNMEEMKQCWAQTDDDFCAHPGWEILRGWDEVRASWCAIFDNTGYMRVQLTDIAVKTNGDSGWVSCIENIYTVADSRTFHSQVSAVNIFINTAQGWKICAHHASALSNMEVEEEDQFTEN